MSTLLLFFSHACTRCLFEAGRSLGNPSRPSLLRVPSPAPAGWGWGPPRGPSEREKELEGELARMQDKLLRVQQQVPRGGELEARWQPRGSFVSVWADTKADCSSSPRWHPLSPCRQGTSPLSRQRNSSLGHPTRPDSGGGVRERMCRCLFSHKRSPFRKFPGEKMRPPPSGIFFLLTHGPANCHLPEASDICLSSHNMPKNTPIILASWR